MKPEYSIYIRTLGNGGDKYQKLLYSIDAQSIKPKEVVVVLPNGYNRPKEKLGYERFAFSPKGMIKQRLFAIYDAQTPYVLLLDDDVEFESTYIEQLFATLEKSKAQCAIPILHDSSKSNSSVKNIINRFIGREIYRRFTSNWFMTINRCGGFQVNTNINREKIYYSQTGHGSNCFAETSVLKNICFENELWLEDSGYALPDDQVMFYKMYKQGYKIAVDPKAYFCHLDAASTNKSGDRYLKIAQAQASNYLIFWYKFIYPYENGIAKLWSILCILHRVFWESLLMCLKWHNLKTVKHIFMGWRYGVSYIINH